MSGPILVTGGTGFVGAAVVRALLARGEQVRALVRPTSDRRNLEGLDVELAVGQLEDAASLRAAVAGCHGLFHVAADYRLWVPDPTAMQRANLDGTRALMKAALEADVSRIVYTGSVATLGHTSDGAPADETTPSELAEMVGPYKRSKFLAESGSLPHGRGGGVAGGDRQSIDADRSARHQAHTHGPHRRHGGHRAGCPPMSIPASISSMWTMSPRAICSPTTRGAWENVISSADENLSLAEILRAVALLVGRRAAVDRVAAHRRLSCRARRRGGRARHRA